MGNVSRWPATSGTPMKLVGPTEVASGSGRVLYLQGVASIGGAERDLLAMIKALHGFDPIVVCPNQDPLVSLVRDVGVPVVCMNMPSWRKVKALPLILPAIYRLFRILVSHKIDVLHINDLWWAPIGLAASRLAGIPCITHVRADYTPRHIRHYRLKACQICIPVSKALGQSLERSGVDPARIRLLYSGIDLSRIAENHDSAAIKAQYQIDPGRVVIGSVGNLQAVKGYEFLIRAIAHIKTAIPSILCVIVGGGDRPYAKTLYALVRELDVSDHVVFAGFCDDVYPLLSVMDVFVLASISEGFGIALLEAMALNKPVVATSVGGIPEVVIHGETGLLVNEKDSLALARAISHLLANREQAAAMGKRGRERVEACFSIKASIARLESLYAEVLGQTPMKTGVWTDHI
ncbi:MAG TPA: glycosyltransferase family 1 protein [Nitrospirales bacterium]|nr:glycosyltransferase family 1 protein [Nitrospirales bacterium]HIN32939.1 glycosyltransferase family 1 protein [Nitrospirales bacterium]